MKRYGLFGGQCYYASGGMNDFIGYHDTVEQASAEGRRALRRTSSIDWWHVYDMETLKRVAQSTCTPYGGD